MLFQWKLPLVLCYDHCCGYMTFWCGSGSVESQKESQNNRNQGFCYGFCMMTEESGSESGFGSIPLDPDPGGPKTCGSGGSGSGSATLVMNDTVKVKMLQILLNIQIFLSTVLYNFGCGDIFVWL